MALTPVGVPKPPPKVQESDSGGGLFGSILGAVVGAAATIFSGGAAAPAVLGAAGTGSTIGGLVGGAIDKPSPGSIEQGGQTDVGYTDSSVSRRFQQDINQPNEFVQKQEMVLDGLRASRQAPPEIQQMAVPALVNGFLQLNGKGRVA